MDTTEVLNKKTKKLQKKSEKAEFDSPWKRILDLYFADFMALCWPEKYALIDWDKGYKMLDKELAKIDKDAAIGDREADKLVEIYCKDGEIRYLMLHLEIQRTESIHFARRMFQYRYRLKDMYDKPIASLAVLIDNNPRWRPAVYREAVWGSSLEMRFPIIKIIDYEGRRTDLEASPNPFAAVILAQLAANRYRESDKRLNVKKILTWNLYRKGWSRDQILSLCTFLDWVIALPKALETTYDQYVLKIEEDLKVEYVTTFERLGIQKGESALLLEILKEKFDTIPAHYQEKINQTSTADLLALAKRAIRSQTLEEVFKGS